MNKSIEDLYPLSPMQRGMMFHTLNQPDAGVYLEQIRLTLEPLDAAAFRQAWEHMFERFTALRTSIVGTGRKEPVQVIRRRVDLPWEEHDCSGMSAEEQRSWIRSFLDRDRETGVQLSDPSLNRLTLVRLGEGRYEFIWTVHHIVLDGWSGAIVISDLLKAYESIRQGHSPDLPPVPPFREYIGWLRRQDAAAAERYWKRTLEGFTVPTPIGGDRQDRIGRDVANYGEHEVRLSTELTEALRRSAAAGRITVNTLLQGAWALLLSRYANEEEVVFGTVVSGRPESLNGVDRMVGMFVNTLPLRVNVDRQESTTRWLQTLQRDQNERRQHEHSPLWEIQRWSDVPPGAPLFETLFVFENYRVGGTSGASGGELKVDGTPPFDRTGFPILLLVQPAHAFQLRVTYDEDRFEQSTIERMVGDLEQLLRRMTEAGDAPLAQLLVLEGPERQRILQEWNKTEREFPADQCMHHLFERQVDERPEARAVELGSDHLTFEALEERANRLAHHLQALGVGPDVPVGLCVERSLDMIVGVLGILKAGGGYVPLDPAYPPERLSYMLSDSAVPVVLTHERVASALPALETLPAPPTVVRLDRDAAAIAARPAARPETPVTQEHLLYVLYTSGSTGRPKGVAMHHAPLVNLMHWQLEESKVGAGERTLQFAPFSFDVSCQEIFATLAAGGTLCLIDETLRRDPEALLERLDDRSVARVFMPFVALQALAEAAERTERVPKSLREVITAGEQLQVTPALNSFFERLGDCTLCNQYGPTECHVVSSYTCAGPPAAWPTLPPIGRPIANTRLYLLDRSGEPVPVGVPGELFIGGRAVARGYLGDARLTEERFTDDPHCGQEGARRYRTGDLGRYLPDGNIEFLGRADHQVKLRGYRVEPGEVESVLVEHPAVQQAAAVVREDRPGDRRLIGYVVPGEGRAPDQEQLRSFVTTRLPEYMVPSAFVSLPSLPLTPSGKIDRRALLAERLAPLEQRAAYVAPRDGVEEVLASIWADVLGVADPGVHDNFFELGGHSLMVTQLVSGIRDTLRTELALRDVFDHPTISQLAALVTRDTDGAVQPALAPVPRTGDLPLSFAQRRLWFLDQLGSGAAYNMPWAFQLEGELDVSVFEKSLNEITRRHEVLRTCFPPVDGKPVQRIRPAVRVPVKEIDLSGHDRSSAEAESRRLYAAEAKAPFDLAHGPLLRATVIHLPAEQHLLLLSIHHIVFDGWSIGVLNHELCTLYRAFSSSADSPLAELPVQYADFSTWQNAWLQGEVVDRQLGYWRQQLEGLPPLNLPTDRPRPLVQSYDGDGVRFELAPDLTRSLRALSQRQGVTLAMTLLAAFKTLLSRWSGQPDIAVGSPIANRSRSEVEDLIGFFVNSLVLRTDLSGDPTFVELLKRIKQTSLSAYEHQDLPFERLVEELQPERDQSRNPLFQVVFALQNASRDALQLPGLKVRPFDGQVVATRFDLELHLQDLPNGLRGGFCYNVELFDRATIERLVEQFRLLLERIVADPQARISQFSILSDAERHVLLEEWNDTSVSYPVTDCLHVLFERQVERTPEHVATVFQNEQLTYAEVNRRANQLAHRLRALGVGPDTLVGLSLDRGLDLVIGILGILKAGGGYVPLDLANPPERIAFILQDTKLRVLVTESSELEKIPGHEAQVVCLDAHRSETERESVENPTSGATPDNVAYVIYTSGSTGTPKGVLVEHGSVVRLFSATEEWFCFGAEDVWTLFHSSAFDFSVWELWGALLYGGRLVVVPFWVSRSPEDFYRLLDHEQVTVLNQTPSAFYQLILVDETLGADRRLALRCIIFGGEALDLQRLKPWFERHGDERPQLVNMYGITETTVHVTYRPLNRRDLEEAPGSVIGQPIPDLQIYILDEHLAPVPIGVPGEMYVGGAGVARGYLDRPELTEQRFLRDPFSAKPDARLYRTGDVGRYLPDGDIEYLGRNDEQVKIRGYRIELGEIEAALNAHPQVRESVVALRDGQEGNRHLLGYVVPQEEGTRDGPSTCHSENRNHRRMLTLSPNRPTTC